MLVTFYCNLKLIKKGLGVKHLFYSDQILSPVTPFEFSRYVLSKLDFLCFQQAISTITQQWHFDGIKKFPEIV